MQNNIDLPTFINAVDSVISKDSITENNGANIYIGPYNGISEGGVVTLFGFVE